jgi:hypothetical protein
MSHSTFVLLASALLASLTGALCAGCNNCSDQPSGKSEPTTLATSTAPLGTTAVKGILLKDKPRPDFGALFPDASK